jgi:glycosyltransferase involved in cell wall biosynthesis
MEYLCMRLSASRGTRIIAAARPRSIGPRPAAGRMSTASRSDLLTMDSSTTTQPSPPASTPDTAVGELDLTVVIPAFNEEGAVRREVERLHAILTKAGLRFEIIVVDDGSSDRTAEEAAQAPCRLLRQRENRGYGASLKHGIAEARSEIVAITDADGTYPPESLPSLVAQAASYDMVVGSRTGTEVHIPLARRPAKWFLNRLASYLAGRRIPDLNSGMRVMRRSLVERYARILPSGFSFTTTITLALLCNDYSVLYVPIDYAKRVGSSKIRPMHAYHFTLLILRAVVLFNPLKVFLPIGSMLFLFGLAKLIYDFALENVSESALLGILGAVIIWALGLLADQNSRLGLERKTWHER